MRGFVLSSLLVACSGSSPTSETPSAAFTAPDVGNVGQALVFDGAASQKASAYQWDFGDGSRGGSGKLAHIYASAGTYSVKLTVAAAGGKTASATHDVTIAALTPGPVTPVVAVLRDTAGQPLEGVTVSEGAPIATSGADGRVVFTLSGNRHTLKLEKDGYAAQFHSIDLTVAQAGYFEATLITRQPAMPLDADKGGTLTGKEGATVTIPGGALVDGAGQPVTGMVTVALTPVDITAGGVQDAFPGRFEGTSPDATTSTLVSYGTTEYALYRGNERLQLAPGRTATIEVPSYATFNLDGTGVKEGDRFPLWSLDENSGGWIEEGEGKIVASAASPTRLAMRAEVSHFSWWNQDDVTFNGTSDPLECRCEHEPEICAMFGKAVWTCHVNGQPAPAGMGAATAPGPTSKADLDIVGPTKVRFPAMPLNLVAWAMGGALQGTLPATFVVGQSQSNIIQLEAPMGVMNEPDTTITLPYTESLVTTRAFSKRRYHVMDPPIGAALAVSLAPELGATGAMRILDPAGNVLGNAVADSKAGGLIVMPSQAGDYVVEVMRFTEGSSELTIKLSTVVDETLDAPFDKTVDMQIGDLHRYHFPSEAGAEYDVKWIPSSFSGGSLNILDPAQSVLYTNTQLDTTFDKDFVTASAGTYTVTLQATVPVAGTLRVIKLANGPSNDDMTQSSDDAGADGGGPASLVPILLPFTTTVMNMSGTVGYSFNAAAGTGVIIRATSGTALLGAVRLREAGGTLVSSFSMANDSPQSPLFHPVLLQTGGGYVLEIDPPSDGTHSFLIDIQGVTNIMPITQRLQTPGTITGTSGTLGYTFSANAGDAVRLHEARVCGSFNGDILYQDLTFAENDKLATATTTGTQLVVVRKKTGANCVGMDDYDLKVWVAVPITPGTPSAPFSFDEVSFVKTPQSFSFTAAAGTVLCGKVTGSSFDYFYNQLFGESFTPNSFVSDFGPWAMTQSGTHILEVDSDSNAATRSSPSTVMYLYQVAPPSAVADPTSTQHATLGPGERKWFAISSSDAWTTPPSPSPAPTTFTVTFRSDDAVSRGKAIVYKDNGTPFYQLAPLTNTGGGNLGTVNGTSGATTITAASTWYVQLTTDPSLSGPTTPIGVTWIINPSP